MTCCAIRGATALRTPPTKCAGPALFDERRDAVCTERIVGLTGQSLPLSLCLELFGFSADFGEPIREAATAGAHSGARHGSAEHLQDVLGAENGIDDAIESGPKEHGRRLWLRSEMARFGSGELKFALEVGQCDIQVAHGHPGIPVAG